MNRLAVQAADHFGELVELHPTAVQQMKRYISYAITALVLGAALAAPLQAAETVTVDNFERAETHRTMRDYVARTYRPKSEIISGEWVFPEMQPTK
jgi:hypothetical protein